MERTPHAHAHTGSLDGAPAEFREAAERVRNWGRWGPEDELGTLNLITPEALAFAAGRVRHGRAIACGVPFNAQGPQGAHGLRRNPIHVMTIDGGDRQLDAMPEAWRGPTEQWIADLFRQYPGRFTDDYVIMPLQGGTQWDALSHFYYGDQLYNGYPASAVTSIGAVKTSIEPVAMKGQVAGRGVLLDVARHRGVDHLGPDEAIQPEELDAVLLRQQVELRDGDILMVRTGWRLEWLARHDEESWAWASPGLGWRCAEWCHRRNVAAVAADNVGVEVMKSELEGLWSPFHMLALRDMGMLLGEIWDLEALGADCAADGVYDVMLVATALPFSGGVGTPVNPVAFK